MIYELSCNTSPSEIRRQLRQWSGRLYVELAFECIGNIYGADVVVAVVAPSADDVLNVECIWPNEEAFTLTVPRDDDRVLVVDAIATAQRLVGSGLVLPLAPVRPSAPVVRPQNLKALEEYMR